MPSPMADEPARRVRRVRQSPAQRTTSRRKTRLKAGPAYSVARDLRTVRVRTDPLVPGLIGFTGVVLLGVLLFLDGRMPRLFWGAFQVGLVFAAAFITWLQTQSLYDIGRLCPYCMVVWAAVIPLVVIGSREAVSHLAPSSSLGQFLRNWTALIIMLWYVAVAAAVWFRFGSTLWA